MKNKNLQLIDLTVEELIYLSSFVRTIKPLNLPPHMYHFGTYAEQCICITKSDINKWEVYIIERGKINFKQTFSDCFYACIELLRYATNSNHEYIKIMNIYRKEVNEMKNSLKQIEVNEFIPQITNSLLQIKKTKK